MGEEAVSLPLPPPDLVRADYVERHLPATMRSVRLLAAGRDEITYFEQVAEHLRELLETTRPAMHLPYSGLRQALCEGVFRVADEEIQGPLTRSPAQLALRQRLEVERYGEPVLYGYACPEQEALGVAVASVYGCVRVEFVDAVLDQTTLTIGDSGLESEYRQEWLEACSIVPCWAREPTILAAPAVHDPLMMCWTPWGELGVVWYGHFVSRGYFELQYRGPISVAEIARVVLLAPPDPATRAALAGVEWEVDDRGWRFGEHDWLEPCESDDPEAIAVGWRALLEYDRRVQRALAPLGYESERQRLSELRAVSGFFDGFDAERVAEEVAELD